MDDREIAIESKLQLMKREIDALQISVTGSNRPWYKDFALHVSVIAVLFSFGTTYVSHRKAEAQEVQSTRQELRGLLQRLSALPRENVENMKKFPGDPTTTAVISGFINQENTLLARQAAELAKRLPTSAISAAEYYSVAVALQSAYDLAGAAEFLELVPDKANDFTTEIAAIRMKANLQFIQGRPEKGRTEFQKALDIFSKYPHYDLYTKVSTNIWTELSWAYSEASYLGKQGSAAQHIGSAERLLATLPPSPGAAALAAQIGQTKQNLAQAGTVAPNTGAVPLPPGGAAPPSVLGAPLQK